MIMEQQHKNNDDDYNRQQQKKHYLGTLFWNRFHVGYYDQSQIIFSVVANIKKY